MHKLLLDLPTSIETERLIVRCYQPGDGEQVYQAGLRNREHFTRFETGNPINYLNSVEEAEILVREFAAGWVARSCFFWGIFEKSTGAFAGQVYVGVVNWDTPEFEVGYIADIDHAGRGYITEAVKGVLGWIFQHLGAHRVSIHCSEENARSQRVAERCGFVLEGRTREDHRAPDGHLDNSLHYGLLRTEMPA